MNVFGDITTAADPKGNVTRMDYDKRGNKIKETSALGFATEYKYDENGNQVKEKNGEESIETSYNRNNQPVRKAYGDGNVKNFSYDQLGRLTAASDKKSSYIYRYDSAGNMVSRYDEINRETLSYEYDKNGNRTRLTPGPSPSLERGGGKTVTYQYDGLNQIVMETVISSASTTANAGIYSSQGPEYSLQYPFERKGSNSFFL